MKYLSWFASLFCVPLLTACGEDEPACTLSLATETIQAAQCGQANGSFRLVASGGSEPVVYHLDDSTFQASASFEALPPGTYNIIARDETGCTATVSVAVPGKDIALTALATTTPSACNQAEGRIMLEVSGGTAPYTYHLNDSVAADTPEFRNLPPGEYHLWVRDAKGCSADVEALITSGIRFEATIKEMITTTCAVTGCHVAPRVPDFSSEKDIFAYAVRIRERTGEGSMPPPDSGRSLTAKQIAQIACWVSDGTPDN